ALKLLAQAAVLLAGYRPGVPARLGLGPAACAPVPARLLSARLPGWGPPGPRRPPAGPALPSLSLPGLLPAL
ncbi:CoA transferase, partial [Mycobacterium tuberculosis]|uniref:CoA transferase n=1 Tax=Mycobacterium tuberculosis TaxID=1773 RepID=UPI0015F29825